MYRLFYNLRLLGDVLLIEIAPGKEATSLKRSGDIIALFHEEELIGYNIFHLKDIVKLKTDGVIFAPDDRLIDIINILLRQQGFPILPYTRDSGYKVAKIIKREEHPLDEKKTIVTLSLKGKTLTTVSAHRNLLENSLVVVALDGTILADGSLFRETIIRNIPQQARICSGLDLKINAEGDSAFLPNEGEQEGDDFFLGGE
ncbi:MAG: DUF4479 domain-containing protein [Bacilli bacterium]|nr:DUF4479 domain-containing protein [Bacilli bacterium]